VKLLVVASALAAFAPSAASAACRWEWVCDGSGHCAHVPLCDRSLDIVPPEPPSLRPIPPPAIRPIPRPTIPPIGTSDCTEVQRRNAEGRWVWETVCH
jgi:hypothetical protein